MRARIRTGRLRSRLEERECVHPPATRGSRPGRRRSTIGRSARIAQGRRQTSAARRRCRGEEGEREAGRRVKTALLVLPPLRASSTTDSDGARSRAPKGRRRSRRAHQLRSRPSRAPRAQHGRRASVPRRPPVRPAANANGRTRTPRASLAARARRIRTGPLAPALGRYRRVRENRMRQLAIRAPTGNARGRLREAGQTRFFVP